MLYKTYLLKSISYLLVFVKNFLTKSYFPKFCKELKTGTIRSSFQKNISGFQSLDTVAQYPIFLATCHGVNHPKKPSFIHAKPLLMLESTDIR